MMNTKGGKRLQHRRILTDSNCRIVHMLIYLSENRKVLINMSRGKNKRKALQKQKRKKKIQSGKRIPFDLQNSPKKYPGLRNKYCYKTNIHNLIYKDGSFYNVKYQASNITACNLKNAVLVGVDFVGCNLKNTNFSGAKLSNVVFMNCNLKKAKFSGCQFDNVYFIMTDISQCVDLPESYEMLKKYPEINIGDELREALVRLSCNEQSYKYHVLHIDKKKFNLWNIEILLNRYGQKVEKALLAFSKKDGLKNLYTLHSYANFIEKYLKL